jgi:DNA-binding winged helix-turn-helix (wHTH) protein
MQDAMSTHDLQTTYRFGPYLLDVNRRTLFAGSQARPIPEKLFQLLVLLLEADGGIVRKQTFFARVWPEEIASEANLTQHIFMLRQMLGERASDNAYVITVAGKGYRLAMPVERKAGLTMKGSCERCGDALPLDAHAFICSYECTFCAQCAANLHSMCPNCGGELVARPRRALAETR